MYTFKEILMRKLKYFQRKILKDAGFTFMEVIVSIVFMGLVTLGSLAYTKFTVGRSTGERHYDHAIRLAEDAAEILKSRPYNFSAPTITLPKYGINFRVGYAASEPTGLQSRFKVVIVTVTWTADEGRHEVYLWTRISPED